MFDDTDPELASYLGVAKVSLMALAHDKAIKGTFELHQVSRIIVLVLLCYCTSTVNCTVIILVLLLY